MPYLQAREETIPSPLMPSRFGFERIRKNHTFGIRITLVCLAVNKKLWAQVDG